MALYWGTWGCSNTTDNRTGKGPMALYYNSGVFENVGFSVNNWGEWPWNYDGTRMYLGIADQVFKISYPGWAASTTYHIGDIITVAGVSFVLNGVNGQSSAGLAGTSGTSTPPFANTINKVPGADTPDALLQWMSIGNRDYWHGCALKAGDGYRNNILMMQATAFQEPDKFAPGILEQFYRTGDASPGDETGHTYTEVDGRFGGPTNPLTAISPSYSVSPSCQTGNATYDPSSLLVQTGTSTYWTGGSRLALCYSSSHQAVFATSTNSNRIDQLRIRALSLQFAVAYWMAVNDPNWINTPDEGARMKRMVETALAMLDMFEHFSSDNFIAVTGGSSTGVIAPGYQSGQITEALIHYYQAEQYYSNTTNFPCPSGGYTVCVSTDERIPVAVKGYADWAWLNTFDRIYDKNQSLKDSCYPNPICQNTRRLHSYSFPYNTWSFSDYSVESDFQQEGAGGGEQEFTYSWLWARDSTLVPPSNGRISVTSYRDIMQIVAQHTYDGRNCPGAKTGIPGNCSAWNIADYFNGGRSTGIGFNNLVNGNKTIQQSSANTLSEGIQWMNGTFTASQGVMTRSANPCWIVANRAADGSCIIPSPFPG